MTARPVLPQGSETGAAVFEIQRFEWARPDRIEIEGVWSGLRARRFMRPTLVLKGEGEPKRLLAVLEHKPWQADDGGQWIAAFAWDGDPVKFSSAEMNVGSGIDLELPAPLMRPGRGRRFPKRVTSRDASRATAPAQSSGPGVVTAPIPRTIIEDSPAVAEEPDAPPVADEPDAQTVAAEPDAPVVPDEPELAAAASGSGRPLAPDRAEALRRELDKARSDLDRYRKELDEATEQARALRSQIEEERQERERAVAEARASERSNAATMLGQGAELRAAVERQREIAYGARDAAEQAKGEAIAARDRAVAAMEEAERDRKQAERDRDKAFAERDRAHKERERAFGVRDDALRERDEALAERDAAHKERDEIVSLHERGLPIHEPKPRFLPSDSPGPRSELELWLPRAVAMGILLLFAVIVLRLLAGA